MAQDKSISSIILWIFLMLIEDCDGNYRYYSPYMYSYKSYYSSSGGSIAGVIGFSIVIILTIICCCLCCKGKKENANTRGVMYLNTGTQQRIVTSNTNFGIHYPTQSNAANSTARFHSPIHLSPCNGHFNNAFQYGNGVPSYKLGALPLPPYTNEPAPSYESVVGQNTVMSPPYPSQEKGSNMTDPPPYKA
ncbi:uncharacterized protein LOC134282634 [Saccostrea cucullata]|uniref:uncharacterized protein LOC134282634 n=1 Tax=Saccostrea cuccullata TaxID=36930 RepID=UPI002ED23121